MSRDSKIDRKQFLTWSVVAAGGVMLGCTTSDNSGTAGMTGSSGAGGNGGGGNAGSTAGSAGSTAGSGGSTGGTGGTATAGTGGGGAGGSTGGTGGTATAGSGGGGAGGSTGGAPSCSTKLKITITSNHGHALNITLAEITAHVTKTYSTKGVSDHDHFVQITAADFQKLAAGMEVRKPTCNDEHEHEYIINCVGTEGDSMPNVAALCGSTGGPNRKCGESATHVCPDPPYPAN